jgi:peptidyl-prolyl cis-trans isomerase SurA
MHKGEGATNSLLFFLTNRICKMKYKFPFCAFFLLVSAATGAQVASHAPTVFTPTPTAPAPTAEKEVVPLIAVGKPVVSVNGSVLTDIDLVREETTIFPYARLHQGIPKPLEPQIRSGAMKMMIFEELVYQEALRRKMTIPAAKLRRAEGDFRAQFSTPQEFDQLMQTEFHGSEPLFKEKVRRSLLIDALLKQEITDKDTVSPAEVRAAYDKSPARWEYPESYTFQTISVLPPAKATAAQLAEGRKRADDALKQAKATKTAEEFGLLAERISDDDYRVMMGQHKPIAQKDLAPPILTALRAMKPGDVSGVIQIDQAYTIVRLNEHTPAGKTKFIDVKAQLEKELEKSKAEQLRGALDRKLRENAKIEAM